MESHAIDGIRMCCAVRSRALPGLTALCMLLLVCGCAVTREPEQASPTPVTAPHNGLGIAVVALRLSASGYMLDLRYRITDAPQARALLDRRTEVYLLDQASGARLMVPVTPTVGPLRQVSDHAPTDRTYFALFANPERFVRQGAKLTLVVGGQRIEGLTVE